MATVAFTANALAPLTHGIYTWTPLTTTNTDGAPVGFAGNAATIQANGTFGVGGTVVLQGSNDGALWTTLTDLGGAAISFTAAGLKSVREAPPFMRPFVTGGDGTTSLTLIIALRRQLVNA